MSKSNDDKIKEYRQKKIKKWIFIALSILIIALEILALFNVIDMLWGCILFVLVYILKKNI